MRLEGGRQPPQHAPFAWTGDIEDYPDEAIAPVFLGHGAAGCLHADLVRTPDVVTVTGDPAARRRLAASFVQHLCARPNRAFDVTVVGDVLGSFAIPPECQRAGGIQQLTTDLPRDSRPHLVFCAPADDHEMALLQDVVTQSGWTVVPIIVGDVPSARWSLKVHPAGAED